jgi:hypothetical protein
MPDEVVLDGPDWGKLDHYDESVVYRLERDRRGRIDSHWVPVWLPPLSRIMRPGGAARQPRRVNGRPQGSRRVARTNGSRGDPDSSDPDHEAPPQRQLGGAGVASSRLWAHVRRREAKGRLAVG